MSLPDLRPGEQWRRHAVCRTMDTNLFFPEKLEGQSNWYPPEVWAACRACPVRKACLDYALEHGEEFGVWGGKTPTERKRIHATQAACRTCDAPFRRRFGGERYCADCRLKRPA